MGEYAALQVDDSHESDRLTTRDEDWAVVDQLYEVQTAKRQQEQRKRRTIILIGVGIGGALLVLIALSSVATTLMGWRKGCATAAVVLEPCRGSDLACKVVHKLPVAEEDYRGLPRRLEAKTAVVSADSSRCSEIGKDVLQEGGNAVDATVAVALCQGVVNPIASGLGGGAFITIRLANGSSEFINARELAPAAANATMFEGKGEYAALDGGLAIGVPMELKGLELAWKRHGSLPWARLVRPAAELARSGFAFHPYLQYVLEEGLFNYKRVLATPLLRAVFFKPNGSGWRLPAVGELCCQRTALADTLDNIAAHGADWLYSPAVASTLAAEIQAAGGIVSAADLAAAQAELVPLMTADVAGYTLHFPPPPSSAVAMIMALKLVAGFGPAAGGTNGKLLQQHRLVESMKHAFALRLSLGDPGLPGRPQANISAVMADLTSDAFIASLRKATSDDHVLDLTEYGGHWNPFKRDLAAVPDDHGTSHFNVVDQDRNAVSITSTINTVFGSGVVSPSTGIILNNEMADFSTPSTANKVTPVPTAANFAAAGKRPLSAMSPTIVVNSTTGDFAMAVGASGGPLIVTATLQGLVRVLLEGKDAREAIMDPRLHDQLVYGSYAAPGVVMAEDYAWGSVTWRTTRALTDFLDARGDTLAPVAGLGVSQMVVAAPGGGGLVAMSDARKDGAPSGY